MYLSFMFFSPPFSPCQLCLERKRKEQRKRKRVVKQQWVQETCIHSPQQCRCTGLPVCKCTPVTRWSKGMRKCENAKMQKCRSETNTRPSASAKVHKLEFASTSSFSSPLPLPFLLLLLLLLFYLLHPPPPAAAAADDLQQLLRSLSARETYNHLARKGNSLFHDYFTI